MSADQGTTLDGGIFRWYNILPVKSQHGLIFVAMTIVPNKITPFIRPQNYSEFLFIGPHPFWGI